MFEPCCHRFTAAEGGARLAATAAVQNTLVTECGAFISTRLLHEEAYHIRGRLSTGRQRSVRICQQVHVKPDAYELRILTDLQVSEAETFDCVHDWADELETKEVLVCTSEVLKRILEGGLLTMAQINILIVDSCHVIYKDVNLQYIMKVYKQTAKEKQPRILALTYPLFNSNKKGIDKSDSESEDESTTDNMQICEKATETIDDKDVENTIDNVEKATHKVNDINIEEIGVYENLDDFEMYEKLEWRIDDMEKELCCKMDLAEDIDGCKRISGPVTKPKELIIEYSDRPPTEQLPTDYADLEDFMRTNIHKMVDFINDHRHDPTEIYGDELYEEFKNIPDPTIEPKQMFKEFLYVLDELGPYAADKAAFHLLIKLEKSKIKVPYERHFLLLRLCTTVFVKIRCYAELIFSKYPTDWDKIRTFSTPKLLRFVEILEKFTPPDEKEGSPNVDSQNTENTDITESKKLEDSKSLKGDSTSSKEDYNKSKEDSITSKEDSTSSKEDSNSSKEDSKDVFNLNATKMLKDIDQCDFITLGDKIEDRLNSLKANLKDLGAETTEVRVEKEDSYVLDPRAGRIGGRRWGRGRGRGRGNTRLQPPAAHTLCGICFLQHGLMAKILFMLCVDLSRCRAQLSYLRCQYCAAETPESDSSRDAARQGKRHEEVLKKFRMHECNLLLTTSVLEEGIDLPRCNLVLRWDIPASYRSYGLCRARARAPRAAAAVMCTHASEMMLQNLATYTELDQLITRKCGCGIQDEPTPEEEAYADTFTPYLKPYTPTELPQTNAQCNCNAKVEKNLEIHARKIKIDTEKSTETNSETVSGIIESVPKTIDSVAEIIESVPETIESVPETIESVSITIDIPNSNQVETTQSGDNKTTESASNLSFASNHLVNVSEIIENVSKSIDDVSESIDSVSEAINCIDSDLKKIETRNQNDVLSENMKNLKINDEIDSDKKCSCNNSDKKETEVVSVDLSNAIALINRYCAKLPSDTFTRLAASWWCEQVRLPRATRDSYICTLRLPLNCPLKYNIVGHPMPTRVLARRMVALQACRILHKSGELDNQLMPIGKENFKAAELEAANAFNAAGNVERDNDESARPGTTKRRQYYYKRTAGAFIDCQPVIDTSDSEIDPPNTTTGEKESTKINDNKKSCNQTDGRRNMLYAIVSSLWCALPERYNTRGRRLHSPQHAVQALGILMARTEPTNLQIPAFPVYTRSGEVRVSVEHVPDADTRVTPRRGRLVRRFMRFVFTEVLRVRRRGMKLQSEGSTKNNYYIVPTVKSVKDGVTRTDIDWSFLELIYQHTEEKKLSDIEKPLLWYQDEEETSAGDVTKKASGEESDKEGGAVLENPLLKNGETFVFDVDKYGDAVVTPWYRNRDQPQFFLVAEICWNLTPDSAFPSTAHDSFRSYYQAKYNVTLTQPQQPLLDVDHTSARLNLLTPRYVNRKGVALPVSSERTRRAKRDRLDQKQILVPELCRVHPFAAPLWFATVALPCVLYRINALLIADEIRRAVAIDVGLGIPKIDEFTAPGFHWPPLDFGWSLSEVLSADAEKSEKKKEEDKEKEKERVQKEKELRGVDKDHDREDQDESDSAEDGGSVAEPEKTVNDILAEKLAVETDESGFEIGTWSNDMASSIPDTLDYDEMMEPLPPNLTFCTSASGGVNWCDPVQKAKPEFNPSRVYSVADSDCSYISSDFDTDDSDFEQEGSDDDADTSGFCNSRTSNTAVGVRIEYKTAHEAEAVDVARKKSVPPAPQREPLAARRGARELAALVRSGVPDTEYVEKFRRSVDQHKNDIITKGSLIEKDTAVVALLPELPETKDKSKNPPPIGNRLHEIFPQKNEIKIVDGQITLESIEKNKRNLLSKLKETLTEEEIKKLNCFSMVDVDIDCPGYINEKVSNVGFDSKEKYEEKVLNNKKCEFTPYHSDNKGQNGKEFDFDYQPNLEGHPGPSPSVILQALTMSNANDGINLERLETIGDSFLKFAITAYLYCAHPTVHEGKLSHMRSKQVSNLNLYRLGRSKRLGARMIASKFEPHDNWLPPCHRAPPSPPLHTRQTEGQEGKNLESQGVVSGCYIPYNLITQHSIPDKSIADCVEALIGAYLLECGPRGALLFMSWLGISVLPQHKVVLPPHLAARCHSQVKPPPTPSPKRQRTVSDSSSSSSSDMEWSEESQSEEEWEGGCDFMGPVGARRPYKDADGNWVQVIYGELKAPPSPLLRYIADPEGELDQMLSGYDALERTLQYRFKDRSLLLQALTHASHQKNRLTDCYQRLEFLGDAILDYLITRHLYEDARRHCPGALTDLRSALVNNTIFATLAVRHGFHKYFRHMSPGLNEVLTKYVRIQEENGHSISEEHYLIQEDELEQAEDVEVPKALGDLFESVAGAIFLDSGMSLGAVWQSYVRLMGAELEAFSAAAPKSPVRELLEAEPDTAKFGKPERLADGRRVRVCVEVFGRGTFKGIGRNYRIAKGTAARCALRHLKIHRR